MIVASPPDHPQSGGTYGRSPSRGPGFRPPSFTVRAESAEAVAATLQRRLTPEMLAEVGRLLAE